MRGRARNEDERNDESYEARGDKGDTNECGQCDGIGVVGERDGWILK